MVRTDGKVAGLTPDDKRNIRKIKAAAGLLRSGRLVAFPTETVYGLGADALNDYAVAAIFEAKGRPRFNPLIVHVPDVDAALEIASWSDLAIKLAGHFWPGPLSLILKRKDQSAVSKLVSAGGDTIALRVPAHPLTRALFRETGRPIAGPSANRSGKMSPTTADHVRQSLGDRVDMVLDGGACPVGVESTVIDVSEDQPRLLRPGGLARKEIENVIGERLDIANDQPGHGVPAPSPGLLKSHYAPRHPFRINAEDVAADEALLAFGPAPLEGAAVTANLSRSGNLTEAAANLFSMLHHLDGQDVAGIAAMPVPSIGLGEAICDRLERAAAP